MKKLNDKLKSFYNQHSGRKSVNFVMSDEASKRVKEEIFSKLGSVTVDSPTPVSALGKLSGLLLKSYVLVPLLVILFITGTTYASANSLPGDSLYGVKRQVEKAQLLIAPTEEAKLELEERFAQKRLDEFERISSNQSPDKQGNEEDNERENVDKSSDTVINIDGDSVSSDRKNNKWQHQDKAREEADKAVESLKKTREDWQRKGNNEKADEVERKVRQYRQQLEDHEGQVRGAEDSKEDHIENLFED